MAETAGNTQDKTLCPTAHFVVRGARPSQEEAARLSALTIGRKLPGKAEIKHAVIWFLVGAGVAALAWFFGRWALRGLEGPAKAIFGYGPAYVGAPAMAIFALYNLFQLFGSARKKTVKAALDWQWRKGFLGDNIGRKRFGKMDISLSILRRMVPEGLGFDESRTCQYITGLRQTLGEAADRTSLPASKTPPGDWAESYPNITCVLVKETEILPSVREVEAVLTFYDQLQRTDNWQRTHKLPGAVLEITIVESFVCAGGYWFPYDLYPAIELLAEDIQK